ncbi:hypothetical protein V8B97DRAFT_2022083 [Scleroderma yunnanense]
MAVKVLHLWPAVSPKQVARILTLCQGLQEWTLQIATNLLDEENPLHGLLCDLQLTTLCMNITSVFYSPKIYPPNLHLHLMNSWVAWQGLFIGLHKLSQLTHLFFHIHPPGQWTTHPEVLFEIFKHFLRLQVVILWQMEYHASKEIYSDLVQKNIMNYCIVGFNSALFAECTESISSFWEIAEWVVQWWEDNQECCNVPSHILSFNLLA